MHDWWCLKLKLNFHIVVFLFFVLIKNSPARNYVEYESQLNSILIWSTGYFQSWSLMFSLLHSLDIYEQEGKLQFADNFIE